jgi:hypothetical protein
MKRLTSLTLVLALTGCQTAGYQQYADAMARIAEANAEVSREQARAMKDLAQFGGDQTTRAIAVVMLALGAQSGKAQQIQLQPPQNEALQWAQVILPSAVSLGLGYWGYRLGVHQSDNQASTTQASYGAITGVAGAGFNAIGSFKPAPIDFSSIRPNNTTVTTINNRDGNAAIGGDANQDNSRPVVVVPPVTIVPPVVITPVITGP